MAGKGMDKYVKLLEADLERALERERELRKDLEFYRGKCARLELAIRTPGTASAAPYVNRIYADEKPQPGSGYYAGTEAHPQMERIEIGGRKSFADLKREWNALSEQQQNKIVEEGKWEVQDAGQ